MSDDAVTFLLMPSPLLGGSVWEPVAEVLRAGGHDARVVSSSRTPPSSPNGVMAHLLAAVPPDGRFVLVPHSNAGLFVPFLVSQRSVVGAVFVDARLPPSSGTTPVAEDAFLEILAPLADADGVLPPWPRWWDDDTAASLYPTPEIRERIVQEAPRLPLAYYRASVTVPDGWERALGAGRGAYLAFGAAYRAECDEARRRGWPVVEVAGAHLHMLHDPEAVAEWIVRLADR